MRPEELRFDDDGWTVGALGPTSGEGVFTLFAIEKAARFDAGALSGAAKRVFGGTIELEPEKRYRANATPIADAAVVTVAGGGLERSRVIVVTFPVERAFALRDAAIASALARGGAGMDSLVRRARRVLQVVPCEGADSRASFAVAALFAETDLAAIAALGGEVMGPKTARSKLQALGVGATPG